MSASISFLTPLRAVLMIGDEALYIYEVSGSKTRLIDTVLWSAQDFEDTVAEILRRECKGKQILVLNDMTDQHFKGGQRIPRVSAMDKAGVLSRKLAVAFPNYPIRGALPVKDKLSKSASAALKANAAGGLYLFAAVPMSEPVSKTMAAIKQSMASIAGFTLLPVESSDMLKALTDKASKKEKVKPRWAVMIGQHQSGGLRQVIIRDGQLAMTRMTPVTDLNTDPEAWTNEVAQEFKATISYLSRFGYSPNDGTEVFVIATPSAGETLRTKIDVPCNYSSFTVSEAANALGMRLGQQDDQYHADPLHAAWAGRKTRFILPMEALDIKKVSGPRQAAMAAALILFCGAAWLSWQMMSQTQALITAKNNLTDQRRKQDEAQKEYDVELARMQELGFDIKLIQGALNTFKEFEDNSMDTLPFAQGIGRALGDELRLDKLSVITQKGKTTTAPDGTQAMSKPALEAILTFSFPGTIDPEYGVRQVGDLSRRLGENLPAGYEVQISKQVADLSYTENTVGEVGSTNNPNAKPEDFKAEITIKGQVQ